MLKDNGNKSFWKDIRRWWCFHPSKIFPNCWQIEVFLVDGNFVVFISSWGNALDGFDFFLINNLVIFQGKKSKTLHNIKKKVMNKKYMVQVEGREIVCSLEFLWSPSLDFSFRKKSDWTRFSWQTRLKSNSILVKIDSDVLVMRYLPTNQAGVCHLHLWPPLGKM